MNGGGQLVLGGLVGGLLGAGLGVWLTVAARGRLWSLVFPAQVTVNVTPPIWATGLAVVWIVVGIAGRIVQDAIDVPQDARPNDVWMAVLISGGMLLALVGLMRLERVPDNTSSAGPSSLAADARDAGLAVLLAALPTAILLGLLSAIRTTESQHALLRLLGESPGWSTVLGLILAAVVIAPLSEELQFRVLLQGWLRQHLPRDGAILLTAALFCLLHGWRDALALAPLAIVLGELYDRRRSYRAVVLAHGLFNATNLVLAYFGQAAS